MDLTGKLYDIFEPYTKGSFTKREFVILDESNDKFPQHIKFELVQDKISLIDSFNKGDVIKVYFNVKGREWTNPKGEKVYFLSLGAWKIEQAGSSSSGGNSGADDFPPPGDDDMPF
jgi:hypothetical protein